MRDVLAEVPLVGRVRELRVLDSALSEVGQGTTAAVFVTGESGVGKTRLLAAASDRMRTAGAVVLSGACLDIGDASPFHALRQALRRFEADPRRGGPASAAARDLIGVLDRGAAGPDGPGDLLERLSRGLHALAGGQVLVLVIDDLQWADRTTRQLLLYLLAGLGDLPMLLLGAARAETLHGSDPLRQMLLELRRLRSVQVLELAPLDRAETAELAAAITDGGLPADAVEVVWARSGGNPFVVGELARDVEDGRVGLPDTLREIVLARVDALPESSRAVVHALAAGVEPVEHALLAAVVDLPEEDLIGAVRTTVQQRVVVSADDGYRCRHRLLKEVLEPELLPGERILLHRRFAEALTGAPGAELRHARLAHHWRLAGDRERALSAAVAAAEEAEALHGFDEAHEHWTAALELTAGSTPGSERLRLRQRAAEAAHRSGEHERALALLDEVLARHGDTPPCWLLTLHARYLAAAGRATAAEAEYERVLAGCGGTTAERATAAAHSAELLLRLGRYADAGQRARHALDLAHATSDAVPSIVLASAALGFSEAYLNDPEAGLTAVRDALATAERSGSPDDVCSAHLQLAELLAGPLNELEQGVTVARRGAERAEQLGLGRSHGTHLLAVAANALFRLGRWAEAEKLIAAALRRRPSGTEVVELLLSRSRLSVGYGDLDAAEVDLDAVATLMAGGGARHVVPLLTLRAGLATWRAEYGEARRAVRDGLRLAESRSDDVWLLAPLVWHGLRAEAEASASGAGGPDEQAVADLRSVANRIAESATATGGPVRDAVAGYRELCAAELSRIGGTSDAAVWVRAAEVWERRGQPYPAAYARLRQAEALFAERTRNAAAAAALRSAHRTAQQLGARPLTAEVEALAARARLQLIEPGPRQAEPGAGHAEPGAGHAEPAPGRDAPAAGCRADELAALTRRELVVLDHVAAGRSNREIGRLLFISERTVGVHVSRILAKLGVRSRVQASVIVLRRGQPDRGL
ncbi:MAG TPA: AAA family ATPase [Mycobacteriales bacterium]|jgi:DNA-binding CsgD family transcriptional regulator/tetratricopeptide (TPR) repeat protein|nr:AAA family ATPase [Mycobacteriales bacterium]